MSRTIDERVVEMRFDNKQFESGTKQTLGTLEKLKQALKFQDVGKGFEKIQKSANQVVLVGLENAVESVKVKFSTLEVVAITAMTNIVNKAVDAGVRLAKSLSIDQIIAGFGEYELKMGSIQTIIASTGESLETVNKYLEELNKYSDKTIYSFSDMTQNIGKFTNAGVKLEDAVKAIQGVSNEAAVSGANANEASRAMYNFAQALSAGYVKLIDWKSIENANMATMEFKQQLLDTAVAIGTVVKEGDKYRTTTTNAKGEISQLFDATSAFNDSLNHQWMSTEVLVQTLGNYSTDVREMTDAEKKAYEEKLRGIGYTEDQIKAIEELGKKAFDSAQDVKTFHQLIDTMRESVGSGWAQTFELIFGDFEEAKKLWTNVNNTLGAIIKASSDSRNELLRGWKEAGGRDALLGGISNSFNALLSIIKAIGEAFRNVFPKTTSNQLVSITKVFQNLTSKLKPSTTVLDNLRRTFTGLFSIVNIAGQAIGAFFKLLIPGISTVGDLGEGILSVTASIGDWVTKLNQAIKENGVFISAVEKIRGVINDVIYNMGRFVNKAEVMFGSLVAIKGVNFDGIQNAFGELALSLTNFNFEDVEISFDSLRMKIKQFFDALTPNEGVTTFFENVKEYGQTLKEVFTFDDLIKRMETVMDVFNKFFNWIKTTFGPAVKDFNVGTAIAGAGGLGIVYALINISKAFSTAVKSLSKALEGLSKNFGEAMINISKAFESASNTLKSIPELLGGIKNTLTAYQRDLNASALIKTAGAIAILAGALILLSYADTKRVFGAAVSLSLISAVLMYGISKLIKATEKGQELNKALITFATGLSNAMTSFGKAIKIKAIGKAVKDFATSIAIIAVSIIGLGIMWNKNPTAFSAALKTVEGITVVLVAMIALIAVASKVGNAKSIISIGSSILMLCASLTLVAFALSTLMKMKLPTDYDAKLGILAGILAGLAGLAILLSVAAKIAGGNGLPKMGGTISSLALLLFATVLSLKVLFDMKLPTDYDAKLGILAGIFTGFGVLLLTMGAAARIAKGNSMKAALTILAITGFLAVVVESLFVLAIIPTDKMLKGAIGLGSVLIALGIALYGAGKVSNKEAIGAVVAMATTVGAIVASLAVLSIIPWEKLAFSVASLGTVLLTLAANFYALSKINTYKALPAVLSMIAAIITIAYSLYALSTQPWENMLSAGVSLSATLLALSTAFSIVSITQPNLAAIGTFLAASVSVGLIALAIYELSKQPWENLLAASTSLSTVILSMSAAMAICSVVGSIAPAALAGIALLDAFIANFALVLAALGKIFQTDVAGSLMSGGAQVLVQFGQAIGDFVGAIVNGVISGISSTLPQIGTDLSEFMTNLQAFISGSKNIDAGALASVGLLAGIIIALTAVEVINGFTKLFGLSIVNVAVELSNFMEALDPFIQKSKELKTDVLKACGYLATMIITLTAAEILGGIGKVLGLGGNLVQFGKELSDFGPHIQKFSDTVKDVKSEAVQGAAAAAEIMANLARKLPGTDGLVQKFFGEKSLADFGKELTKFGPAIKGFGDTVKDVKSEAVQGAAAAAEIMANLANKLPIQDGLVQKIFGERSLSEFGKELVKFGPSIVSFADQVRDVKPEAANAVSTITTIMTDLANNLPDSKNLWNKIFGGGQVTLSQFGEELVKFGASMSSFSASASSVVSDQVDEAIESFKSLLDLTANMKGNSAYELVNFSNQLGQIATDSINKFVQTFTDAGPRVTTVITTWGSTLKSNTVTVGQNVIQGLINGINDKKPLALSTVKNICTTIINQFRISLTQSIFGMVGQNVIQGLINGINDKKSSALTVVNQMCEDVVTAFRENLSQDKFIQIGENAALGLKYGIENKIWEIARAAIEAAEAAVEAAEDALDEASPSKVMKKVGEFFSIGFANGIIEQVRAISTAATSVADEAINPVKKAVDGITSIIDSGDFDVEPVIRPVIDLSGIREGAREISSLMNRTYDLSSVYNRAMDVSSSFNTTKKARTGKEEVNSNTGETSTTYEFNQYNYSPKALSRSEIYRQTSNQFSAFRRAVNAK